MSLRVYKSCAINARPLAEIKHRPALSPPPLKVAAAEDSAGSGFTKRKRCPSTTELLQYQKDLSQSENRGSHSRAWRATTQHLAVCDFCSAESEFLHRHPPKTPTATTQPPEQIPIHLYVLANILLGGKNKSDNRSLEFIEIKAANEKSCAALSD